MTSAEDVIKALKLEPLPVEGGFFKETYRSSVKAATPSERRAGTCICYLLRAKGLSSWHKVASDEIWLYHAGSPAVQVLLFPDGTWTERVIGPDVAKGQEPQSLIPAGVWQAAKLLDDGEESWGLFGAAVFPGFEYADFEAGDVAKLSRAWPAAAKRIAELGLR